MANTDGSPSEALTREERVAARVVQRRGLEPPIDPERVARDFGEVEIDNIPGECDGLVVGLYGQRPPLIIVDASQRGNRRRFTVAHELGHVLLPWHGGSFACEPILVLPGGHRLGSREEPEANRFASELLIPTVWLQPRIEEAGPRQLGPLLTFLTGTARVSIWVALLRLARALPPGRVFALLEAGRVVLSGQTPETRLDPPPTGRPLDRRLLDQFATTIEESRHDGRHVIWWHFLDAPAVWKNDLRDSRTVLQELLSRHLDPDEVQPVQASLAGIIGSAKTDAIREGRTSAEQLYRRFESRFAKDRDLPETLLSDPDFDVWLQNRAKELKL